MNSISTSIYPRHCTSKAGYFFSREYVYWIQFLELGIYIVVRDFWTLDYGLDSSWVDTTAARYYIALYNCLAPDDILALPPSSRGNINGDALKERHGCYGGKKVEYKQASM